jgi:hypothetical protein
MNARHAAGLIAIGLSAWSIGVIAAVNMPKEGNFDFNYCLAGRTEAMQVSDAAVAGSFELTASIISNIPGGPFDGQGSHCMGTWTVLDGKYFDSGYCMTVDADGDRFLMDFKTGPLPAGQPATGTWTAIGGSGKYQGMVAKGNYKAIAQVVSAVPGGFQNCNRNTGTYKLK